MQTNISLPLPTAMPVGPIIGIALGLVVLGLLLWGIKNPLAWIVVSVLFITAGVGCMVYGITELSVMGVHHAPGAQDSTYGYQVQEAAAFVGGGAGGMVGGVVLLVVSLLRHKKGAGADAPTKAVAERP